MSSGTFKVVLILLAAGAAYLVGNGRTQLFDRDEPRYAQCSRQMLQSGDWVVPRLYDNIRAAKPPGIYWCQATAMTLLGDTPSAARLPSALAAVLTGLILAIVIGHEVGPRHAVWTVFVFCSSALMIWSAKICLTDSVLLLCTTVALLSIYRLWRGQGGWTAVVILAVAIASGGLVKGPFILGVLAATVIVLALMTRFDRWRVRRTQAGPTAEPVFAAATTTWARVAIQFAVGTAIVVLLVAPWVYLVQHRAPQFLGAAREDAIHHLETGSEGHKGPPGYHLLLIWATYLPWSLFLPLSIVLAFKNRRQPQVRFALAVVLGTWVFVEILQTKLPHYILSAFPALAFLTADAIVRCLKGEQKDLESKEIRIGAVILAIVVAGLAMIPAWWVSMKFHNYPWAALVPLSLFGIVAGATLCFLFFTGRPAAAIVSMGCGSLGLGALLFGLYLPRCEPLRLPIRVADVLKQHGAIHPREAVMFEYKEPSLAFYQGGTIREYDYSLDRIAQRELDTRWVVTTRSVWDAATPATRSAFELIDSPVRGLDYNMDLMHPIDVLVLRKK